jgi:hypothetical protein
MQRHPCLGVTRDFSTLTLRPKLGWAVRRGSGLDQTFARLGAHKPAPPLDAPEFDRCLEKLFPEGLAEMPGDFLLFYKKCNGLDLLGDGGDVAYRFRGLGSVEIVENLRTETATDSTESIQV